MAAVPPTIAEPEPGAPIPRDAVDPDLVKLGRARPKIGVITSAAVVAICAYFLFFRFAPDRSFAGEPEAPRAALVADILAGKVSGESFVSLDADPMMSHAIRLKASQELRLVPARGTGDRLWLALDSGDGKPILKAYAGRLRRLEDLPFADLIDRHVKANPRPVFATAASLRAGFATGQVATVTGDKLAVADADRVAFDVIDPTRSTLVAAFVDKRDPAEGDPGHGPLTDAKLWIAELARHGITATVAAAPGVADEVLAQVRLDVPLPPKELNEKLAAAKLLATHVEQTTRHHETTWGALRASPAGALAAGGQSIPEAHVDLVGLYVKRGVPGDAYVLLYGERPQDYWYILPLTIVVAVIGLFFAWAFVRVGRDLLPARGPAVRQA